MRTRSRGSVDDLILINDFLGQGGNPNLKDSSLTTTSWSAFLVTMHECCLSYQSGFLMNEWEGMRRAYKDTAEAFVKKGADLHLICSVPRETMYTMARDYSLDLEFSALEVIKLCLNKELEYSHLRNLCTAKGASYYSRCPEITRDTEIIGDSVETLKLSDRESTTILDIYKKIFVGGLSKMKVKDEMETFLDKLFQDRIEDLIEI